MARKPRAPVNTGEWLNTYADMVTLLLCFFVLLYSMSSIDSMKWETLVKSFNPNAINVTQIVIDPDSNPGLGEDAVPQKPGGDPANELTAEELMDLDFNKIYEALTGYVKVNSLDAVVEVNKGDGYVFVVFRDNVFFDGNSYVLRPDSRVILDAVCDAITGLDESIGELRILGHTTQADPNRPNDIEGDRFLSSNRATQVLVYIQRKNVITSSKLVSLGYGQFHPISPFDTEENRSKNRRIEIFITESDKLNIALEDVYKDLNIAPHNP